MTYPKKLLITKLFLNKLSPNKLSTKHIHYFNLRFHQKKLHYKAKSYYAAIPLPADWHPSCDFFHYSVRNGFPFIFTIKTGQFQHGNWLSIFNVQYIVNRVGILIPEHCWRSIVSYTWSSFQGPLGDYTRNRIVQDTFHIWISAYHPDGSVVGEHRCDKDGVGVRQTVTSLPIPNTCNNFIYWEKQCFVVSCCLYW